MSSGTGARPAPPARGAARERILEVASELFRARGYADVSMQEIADAVGVTKAAMYYHFRSKEELFAAVARKLVNQFWEEIIARAEAGGALRETLESIAHYVVAAAGETVPWRLLQDVRQHLPPEEQRRIFGEHPTPEAALERLFQRAIAAGEMRPLDVEVVADLFVGMAMSLSAGRHVPRKPQPGEADLLVDILLRGIAAVPERARGEER